MGSSDIAGLLRRREIQRAVGMEPCTEHSSQKQGPTSNVSRDAPPGPDPSGGGSRHRAPGACRRGSPRQQGPACPKKALLVLIVSVWSFRSPALSGTLYLAFGSPVGALPAPCTSPSCSVRSPCSSAPASSHVSAPGRPGRHPAFTDAVDDPPWRIPSAPAVRRPVGDPRPAQGARVQRRPVSDPLRTLSYVVVGLGYGIADEISGPISEPLPGLSASTILLRLNIALEQHHRVRTCWRSSPAGCATMR